MGEAPADGVVSLDDFAYLERAMVVLGDSPLAHALRRRRREMDHQHDAIASHESVI